MSKFSTTTSANYLRDHSHKHCAFCDFCRQHPHKEMFHHGITSRVACGSRYFFAILLSARLFCLMRPILCSLKLSEINLVDTTLFYSSHKVPLITTTSLRDQYRAAFTLHDTYIVHTIITQTYNYSEIHLVNTG